MELTLLDAETEQCAKICDDLAAFPLDEKQLQNGAMAVKNVLTVAAIMIRKRKQNR